MAETRNLIQTFFKSHAATIAQGMLSCMGMSSMHVCTHPVTIKTLNWFETENMLQF